MSNNIPTITWKVTNLDCYPKYDQETDVVFTVHWDCLGAVTVSTGSLSGSSYNSRVYGTTGVQYHSGSSFTPYEQLTEPQVLSWTFDSMGTEQKDIYEKAALASLYAQINPPVISPPLPWAPVPPSITVQPQGQTVTTGSAITLTVTATGTEPLSYQWYLNNNTISGATSTTYEVVSATYSDAGSYNVYVSNAGGITQSNTVNVVVEPTPGPI